MSVLALILAVIALAMALLVFYAQRQMAQRPRVVAVAEAPPAIREGLSSALRHVSVVRFDAFDDVSGRQSFAAALLDDRGDGLIITSVYGRSESRTFLKGVVGGVAPSLSPEEQQAVDYARGKAQP